MKRWLFGAVLFILVFTGSALTFNFIGNREYNTKSVEAVESTLEKAYISYDGLRINPMDAYRTKLLTGAMRDSVVPVDDAKSVNVIIPDSISDGRYAGYELRDQQGVTLIEEGKLIPVRDGDGENEYSLSIRMDMTVERDYSLVFVFKDEENSEDGNAYYYYTRVKRTSTERLTEMIAYAGALSNTLLTENQRTVPEESVAEGGYYGIKDEGNVLPASETDAVLDPSALNEYFEGGDKNYRTYGHTVYNSRYDKAILTGLGISRLGSVIPVVKEVSKDSAVISLPCRIVSRNGEDVVYYTMNEFYSLEYDAGKNTFVMKDYERLIDESFSGKDVISNTGRLRLGLLSDENPEYAASTDSSSTAYVMDNALWYYSAGDDFYTKIYGQSDLMTLKDSVDWVKKVPASLPEKMRPMAKNICESYLETAARLMDLGLGYLTLDRASSTLSTGERQRMQLARAVRNRTTGVLYVLDEPSIGLHPANIVGLNGVMHDLVRDGNSVLLVDHDTQILKESDWLIEMEASVIGRYLSGKQKPARPKAEKNIFSNGGIRMKTEWIHTVRPLTVRIPRTGLTVITGVSGSGKTTLILESLVPALDALCSGKKMPGHIRSIEAEGIRHVKLIDAAPIGINVRSTVATYANVHDELRKIFARTKSAKEYGYKAGDFSYNTGSLRCPVCDGTGQISLDVQFLPDVNIPCPECRGSRYAKEAKKIRYTNKSGEECSLPELMDMDVNSALGFCREMKTVRPRLETLRDLGLGYLTLGEETPGLSGGEAQRLKLASEMGRQQDDSVFVFDEPTIGLHPKDVETLLKVFQTLIDHGATVIVIEHDLDVIRAADYIIDMGPEGGEDGGRIVACGTPDEIRQCSESITGKFL